MAAPVADVLQRAAAVLAELHAVDLDGAADDTLTDAVLALQKVRGCFEAAEARVLARWDAQRCWQPSGAKTGAAWLAWKQRIPIQVARQRLRHAWSLRSLPAIEEAWASGDIDRSHLTTLLGARNGRTAEVFDGEGHEWLLKFAREYGFSSFTGADVERIVFDGRSRVLDVGERRRFFRGALRRAIEVRDRTCFHPSCDEVPERLQVDHIHDVSKGGETTQANAQGGCGYHNWWKYLHPESSNDDPDADPSPPFG